MLVGCLLARGFDAGSYRIPRERLESAGIPVSILGSRAGRVLVDRSGRERVRVDFGVASAPADAFAGIYIPGGGSPERLGRDPHVVAFLREVFRAGEPIGVVAQGSLLLLKAALVRGRRVAARERLRGDLEVAGARVLDREVVIDGNLVSSPSLEHVEAFSAAFMSVLGCGPQAGAEDLITVQPSG